MGDYTRADKSRIGHKFDSRSAQRKITELRFMLVFFTLLATLCGYAAGCLWPAGAGNAPDWAKRFSEEVGRRRGKH